MHWTRLRETEHSSWQQEAFLIFYRTFAAPLTGSSTLISFRDLNFFKSPNAISTWLFMVRHEFYCCHATFQSAPWRPAVEPWTEIWSWGSFMVQEYTYTLPTYAHTPVLSKVECLCSACKTPESILHHEEYHIVSSHGWPNFQWMNEANMFMMAWKWQEAIISHSLNPPPSANQQPQLQISNEQIIRGSIVPLSFKNHHDVQFLTHLS